MFDLTDVWAKTESLINACVMLCMAMSTVTQQIGQIALVYSDALYKHIVGLGSMYPMSNYSGSFLAEISVRSPGKLLVFIIYIKMFFISKYPKCVLFNFENRSSEHQMVFTEQTRRLQ